MIIGRKMDTKKIIFIGCDGRYFDLYAHTFVGSLEMHSPGQAVFFSICNPSKDFAERFEALQKRALATHLECETYTHDLSGKEHTEKKAFYANHRFVRLNEFFKLRETNVLFLDIDSIVHGDLLFINSAFTDSDVALQLRLDNKRTRMRVLAAGIFIRYNQRTLKFLEQLAVRLSKNYKWFSDQIYIYTLLRRNKSLKVSDLPSQYLDCEFSEEALIWSGKGDRKFLDERYTSYTERVLSWFNRTQATGKVYFPRVNEGALDNEEASLRQVALYLEAKKISQQYEGTLTMMATSFSEDLPQLGADDVGTLIYRPVSSTEDSVLANARGYGKELSHLDPQSLPSKITDLAAECSVLQPSKSEPLINLRKPYYLIKALKKARASAFRFLLRQSNKG